MMTSGRVVSVAILFLVFAAAGLLFAAGALDAPFFWDDLHLIRIHSSKELAGVWTGTWDPDGLEHPGLRPLSTYFNHLRAAAFGEELIAHRTFLIVLFAGVLTLGGVLARELFTASFWQLLVGGLFAFLHLGSVSHYLWLTDGFFLLASILVLSACLCFVRAWKSGHSTWLVAALAFTVLALLTREDSIIVYPLLILFALSLRATDRGLPVSHAFSSAPLRWFAAGMIAALGIFWLWRAAAVPTSIAPRVDVEALVWALGQTVQNAGTADRFLTSWPRYEAIVAIWLIWLVAVVAIGFRSLGRRDWLAVLYLMGSMIIAAMPAMAVARANLLLLPIVFWGLLLSQLLARAFSRTRIGSRRLMLSILTLGGLIIPAASSRWLQQEFDSANLNLICRNALFIYDLYGKPTIPFVRRSAMQEELARYRMGSADDFVNRWPAIERKARADGHIGVGEVGAAFLPSIEFLPQFRLHPRCEPPN